MDNMIPFVFGFVGGWQVAAAVDTGNRLRALAGLVLIVIGCAIGPVAG